jgi:hypothetical protein
MDARQIGISLFSDVGVAIEVQFELEFAQAGSASRART